MERMMKNCPFCAEEIMDQAIKCKHCGSILTGELRQSSAPQENKKGSSLSLLGLLGAFLPLVGGIGGCIAGMSGNILLAIVGIVLLIVGAGLGAKHK